MQVTELETNGLKKNFKITLGADALEAGKQAELEKVGKTAKIAGFRPGKIPMKTLQNMYGRAVMGDVIDKSIKDSVTDLVAKNNFRPAVSPDIKIDEYNEGGDLVFSVSLELFPELPELNFEEISVTRKIFDITEKDIDDAANRIAERSPEFVELPAESAAKSENIVRIDFKGTLDGVAFEGGTAEDFELKLGSKQFIEGFEDQLIGAKAGEERTVKVTFPAKYPAANLAGKDAEFAVNVKAVLEAKTPEINEEFATSRGFEGLVALRNAIKTQMEREYGEIVRNQLKKRLFDALEEKFTFALPESMVDAEFKTIWERVQQAKASGDEELKDKSEEELLAEYKKLSNRRVKLGILLAEVGTRGKIQISREEISQAVILQANQYPQQARQIFDFYQKNPQRLEDFRGPILEEKAVDFILGKVKFNDEKTALDDLAKAIDSDE